MTVHAQVTADRAVRILEPEKLKRYKAGLTPGSYLAVTFEPWEERRSLKANNYFHALLTRYARASGYDFEYAKTEIKYQFGVWVPYGEGFTLPVWSGKFVEIYGKIIFLKSYAEYTKAESAQLTEGLKKVCFDIGVDIDDLEAR